MEPLIASLILALLSIVGTSGIKTLLNILLQRFTKQAVELGFLPKLILGLGVAFAFAVFIPAIPFPEEVGEPLSQISKEIVVLLSKVIYDTVTDLITIKRGE